MKNYSKRKEVLDNEVNINLGKIECQQNVWACMRFNITRVPYIVQLSNDKMFEFTTYVTEEKLYKFITEDKSIDSGLQIPPQITYVTLLFKVFGEAVNLVNQNINTFISNKFPSLNFEWNSNHTLVLSIVFLVLVIIVEYFLVLLCCRPKKKSVIRNTEEKKVEEIKENIEGKEKAD